MKVAIKVIPLVSLLFVLIQLTLGHDHTAYEHTDKLVPHSPIGSMKRIHDGIRLNQLSLVGAHDSLALHGGIYAQCQSNKLRDLLDAGIRALDVRCRMIKDKFAIHHGVTFQKIFFGEVLQIVKDFLKDYPTEMIVMRIKEEFNREESQKGFVDVLEEYMNQTGVQYFYQPRTTNPMLKEIRGKIVILADQDSISSGEFNKFGINWRNNATMDIQDEFELDRIPPPAKACYKKWESVRNQLVRANKNRGGTKFFVNFLSGSGLPTIAPYFVASGHLDPGNKAGRMSTFKFDKKSGKRSNLEDFPLNYELCVFGRCPILHEGTNILTFEFISKNNIAFTGIVYADFPGPGLISKIIALNPRSY